ncbi:MAG TPA: SPOR domain-containing protein, partial [Candidatus Saccharimonadales bacterium]|nr:SPOR domain-containing protein [Candidatus Saccharimonadales bacterium]
GPAPGAGAGPGPSAVPEHGGTFYLQLGLFSHYGNAVSLLRRARLAGIDALLDSIPREGPPLYRVRTSRWPSREAAERAAQRCQEAGFPTQFKPGGP